MEDTRGAWQVHPGHAAQGRPVPCGEEQSQVGLQKRERASFKEVGGAQQGGARDGGYAVSRLPGLKPTSGRTLQSFPRLDSGGSM